MTVKSKYPLFILSCYLGSSACKPTYFLFVAEQMIYCGKRILLLMLSLSQHLTVDKKRIAFWSLFNFVCGLFVIAAVLNIL